MGILYMIIFLGIIFIIFSIKVVKQSEVYIIERLGKFHKEAHAGVTLVLPAIDRVRAIVSLKQQTITLPSQGVITKDNLTIVISSVVSYQITDPVKVVYETENLYKTIIYTTITAMRDIVGKMKLTDVLASKDYLNDELKAVLNLSDYKWGCKVEKVTLNNIDLPADIRDKFQNQFNIEDFKNEQITEFDSKEASAITQEQNLGDVSEVIKKY